LTKKLSLIAFDLRRIQREPEADKNNNTWINTENSKNMPLTKLKNYTIKERLLILIHVEKERGNNSLNLLIW